VEKNKKLGGTGGKKRRKRDYPELIVIVPHSVVGQIAGSKAEVEDTNDGSRAGRYRSLINDNARRAIEASNRVPAAIPHIEQTSGDADGYASKC